MKHRIYSAASESNSGCFTSPPPQRTTHFQVHTPVAPGERHFKVDSAVCSNSEIESPPFFPLPSRQRSYHLPSLTGGMSRRSCWHGEVLGGGSALPPALRRLSVPKQERNPQSAARGWPRGAGAAGSGPGAVAGAAPSRPHLGPPRRRRGSGGAVRPQRAACPGAAAPACSGAAAAAAVAAARPGAAGPRRPERRHAGPAAGAAAAPEAAAAAAGAGRAGPGALGRLPGAGGDDRRRGRPGAQWVSPGIGRGREGEGVPSLAARAPRDPREPPRCHLPPAPAGTALRAGLWAPGVPFLTPACRLSPRSVGSPTQIWTCWDCRARSTALRCLSFLVRAWEAAEMLWMRLWCEEVYAEQQGMHTLERRTARRCRARFVRALGSAAGLRQSAVSCAVC